MVCHIESSEKFYVHPIQEQTQAFDEIEKELKKMVESLVNIGTTVTVGTVCVVRLGDQMYRAVITSSGSDETSLSLVLLDYGTPVLNLFNAELFAMPE